MKKSRKDADVEVGDNQPTEDRQIERKDVQLTAKANATLSDGTFVREGETVTVSAEYADRLTQENDQRFIQAN